MAYMNISGAQMMDGTEPSLNPPNINLIDFEVVGVNRAPTSEALQTML